MENSVSLCKGDVCIKAQGHYAKDLLALLSVTILIIGIATLVNASS